eukprot:3705140-Rhodomonas_salina.2
MVSQFKCVQGVISFAVQVGGGSADLVEELGALVHALLPRRHLAASHTRCHYRTQHADGRCRHVKTRSVFSRSSSGHVTAHAKGRVRP